MSRMIKIHQVHDNDIKKTKFKIGNIVKIEYPPNSKFKTKIDKIVAYEFNSLLNNLTNQESADFLIDVNTIGIIIGWPIKIEFAVNILKEKGNFNVFWNCLVGNKNCFIHEEKLQLIT